MNGFFASMFAEMGARRRRMRAAFGDRSQALVEFLVLGGLAVGSLGLFVREGMIRAAPWGFALPLVFVIGFLLIELRRQGALQTYIQRLPEMNDDLDRRELARTLADIRGEPEFDEEDVRDAEENFRENTERRRQARLASADTTIARSYDWWVLLWSFGCALLGVAAFVLAWTAQAHVAPQEDWQPPREAVDVDISP